MEQQYEWQEVQGGPTGPVWRFYDTNENPADGPEVTGWVIDWDPDEGLTSHFAKSGEVGWISLDADDGSGPLTVPLGKAMLRDRVIRAQPEEGLLIRVQYTGKAMSQKSGNEYTTWAVLVPVDRPIRPPQTATVARKREVSAVRRASRRQPAERGDGAQARPRNDDGIDALTRANQRRATAWSQDPDYAPF